MERQRRQQRLIGLALFTLLAVGLVASVAIPSASPPPRSERGIRVATLNVSHETNLGVESVERILALEAHVLILFEWTGDNVDLTVFLERGYTIQLEHAPPRRGTHGALVLTDESVSATAALEANSWTAHCPIPFVDAQVTLAGETYRILGIHAPPPGYASGCSTGNGETLSGLADWIAPMDPRFRPDLVIGDFNAFPFDPHRQQLRDLGYTDALRMHQGRWIGTYSHWRVAPHVVPIDEALVGTGHAILGAWTVVVAESDHHMVVVDFEVTESPPADSTGSSR